jgi:hypothetical protein
MTPTPFARRAALIGSVLPAVMAAALPLTLSPARAEALGECPPAAEALLNGFYGWFLASRPRYRDDFASQERRFTPDLYRDLRAGFALDPAEGRGYVDFDPFSGTQVFSYAHRIDGCRRDADNRLIARLGVQADLRRAGAEYQPLDYVLVPDPGPSSDGEGMGWRIDDIRYPDSDNFSLRQFLTDLLTGRR